MAAAEGRSAGFDARHLHDDYMPLTWTFIQVGARQDTRRVAHIGLVNSWGTSAERLIRLLLVGLLTFKGRGGDFSRLTLHGSSVRATDPPGCSPREAVPAAGRASSHGVADHALAQFS
jgi:hypothetical protein